MSHDQEIKITQKVASFVKEKRLARGESLRAFSKYVFDDEKYYNWIYKIESGRGVSLKTVERIFEALACDISIIEN